ncbi:MAG TPA: methyltransferase domain-containing protein [Cyclobacteriaceae bacterium]|jgi:ubiquinone/menaquinone biosynthesis C-methylase UbiE|nr:methyltransferase domain-containing protein [Cyclobacteriaceae bacterium]
MTDRTQTTPFTGSIPKNYDEHMGPMFFEDYAIEIASRIDRSTVQIALELSCGTGRVTNHIRKALRPAARLIASDISPDMLKIAQEKLKNTSIEWRSIDFTKIPFDNASIDLVVCSFGYMFAENKTTAFAEALRVLRPGGTLILSTWDKLESNGASNVFRTIIKKYFGDRLPESYKIPYSMNDPEAIREELTKAGFSKIKIELIEKQSVSESAKKATIGMVQGGSLYNEIIKINPAWVDQISAEVEKELTEKYGAAPMKAPMKALITQAWK